MGRFFITFSRERDMSIEMVESEEDQEESWDDAYANKRTNLCSCRTRNAVSSKLGQRVFGLEKDRPRPGMDGRRRRIREIGGRERVPWGLPDEGWRTSSRRWYSLTREGRVAATESPWVRLF
ncbi:hypothetical protein V1477_014817 [Vespula maculifrons]|uniref:Uncharacterized protein n=1 Tax=Vespula maculifrons TaxID=7453 RepID=A0ABD2BIJ0_VESMC